MGTQTIALAITGASGSIYAERLLEQLVQHPSVHRCYVIFSDTAKSVVPYELGPLGRKPEPSHDGTKPFSLLPYLKPGEKHEKVVVLRNDDFYASIASGSSAPDQFIVLPCSMGTMARIRMGMSLNLIERAADVAIKERRCVILCPREAPLSPIHLEHMLELSRIGVHIVPPSPGFYHHPQTFDDLIHFVIGRVMDTMGLEHTLSPKWVGIR